MAGLVPAIHDLLAILELHERRQARRKMAAINAAMTAERVSTSEAPLEPSPCGRVKSAKRIWGGVTDARVHALLPPHAPLNPPLEGGSKTRLSRFRGGGTGHADTLRPRRACRPTAKHASANAEANPSPKTPRRFRPSLKGRAQEETGPDALPSPCEEVPMCHVDKGWPRSDEPPFLLPLAGRTEEGVPAQAPRSARAGGPERARAVPLLDAITPPTTAKRAVTDPEGPSRYLLPNPPREGGSKTLFAFSAIARGETTVGATGARRLAAMPQ